MIEHIEVATVFILRICKIIKSILELCQQS